MPKGIRTPLDRVDCKHDRFIRMEAHGMSRAEKLRELFGITDLSDKRAVSRADAMMSRWRKHPLYDKIWKEEVASQDYSDFTEARRRIREAMRKKDDWLAFNAAVNVINQTGKRIYAEEEKTISVKVEGLPEIGSPTDDNG